MPSRSDVAWSLIIVFIAGLVIGFFASMELLQQTPQEQAIPAINTTIGVQLGENSVLFLPDKAYFGNLTNYLESANTSVYVVMYVMKYDPKEYNDPVNILLRKLVELKNMGIDVKVIVDDETYDSYPETIEFLVRNGVPVKLDESNGRTTHSKIVVIDGKYVFIGSHNWTESALTRNHETTLLVNSPELARQVVEYIESIWSNGRTISA